MSEIAVNRPLHAELLYHVLAHMDLGADAASLHDPGLPLRPWVPGLLRAYRKEPERLAIHGLPLVTQNLGEVMGLLDQAAEGSDRNTAPKKRKIVGPSPVADRNTAPKKRKIVGPSPNEVLAGRLAAALDAERARVELRLEETAEAARARTVEVLAFLQEPLGQLRQALWDGEADGPPELQIMDCDALRSDGGTHGRAATHRGRQVTALALAAPREQVLCQLLHEEVHAVTDALALGSAGRDTRAGSAGFEVHRRLEQAAVDRGQELVDAVAPQLGRGYRRWRNRHSC